MQNVKIATLGIAVASVCVGSMCANMPESTHHNPNVIYFGPDTFYGHQDVSEKSVKEEIYGIHGGPRLRYDYLQPSSWYAGIDGLYTWGKSHDKVEFTHPEFLSRTTVKKSSLVNFGQIEGRIGYNFLPWAKFRFTPFAGLGGYRNEFESILFVNDEEINTTRGVERWGYYAIGAQACLRITPSFDIGLNAKGMRTFGLRLKIEGEGEPKIHLPSVWGYEIAMPLCWHVSKNKKWDIQLEPYFLKLNTKSDFYFVGGRLLMGYRF